MLQLHDVHDARGHGLGLGDEVGRGEALLAQGVLADEEAHPLAMQPGYGLLLGAGPGAHERHRAGVEHEGDGVGLGNARGGVVFRIAQGRFQARVVSCATTLRLAQGRAGTNRDLAGQKGTRRATAARKFGEVALRDRVPRQTRKTTLNFEQSSVGDGYF